jgi:hypothetical protein
VRAVFEKLTEEDLFEILKSPNNPIILGKKLDFGAYGIAVKFEEEALRYLAQLAYSENTGARGLVSAIERVLLIFENQLPSSNIRKFPVTFSLVQNPQGALRKLLAKPEEPTWEETFDRLAAEEIVTIKDYVSSHRKSLSEKYSLTLTPSRIDIVAAYYGKQVLDIGSVIKKIRSCYDEIKKTELIFFKNHDINIILEDDAIDYIIGQIVGNALHVDDFYKQLTENFEYGLKLMQEKTGKNRFFITKDALINPEGYLSKLITSEFNNP